MLINSETEMLEFGKKLGAELDAPAVLELLGDVGAGKTTLVRGIAQGLGIEEAVTSPSFTISKEYQGTKYRLVHYDFYRLGDPGIMSENLAESISDKNTITIIEWGNSIQDVLPENHKIIEIKYIDENTRELIEK
ncbi:MAG: tRNA (adenosine(37)-N6)-threonylcarbamoyltransferase complex ATPase subunit type 1 TsaE [Candidatus Saccharibacteria bacterium]|nr:tRNA (adenosine(37)-N6)-threonylcarbamoyltransferase complex ATPase subunit type 1 TsaE [Candidatus Saccharibacteria bacterium]